MSKNRTTNDTYVPKVTPTTVQINTYAPKPGSTAQPKAPAETGHQAPPPPPAKND